MGMTGTEMEFPGMIRRGSTIYAIFALFFEIDLELFKYSNL